MVCIGTWHINTRISRPGSMAHKQGCPKSCVVGSSCLCGLSGP